MGFFSGIVQAVHKVTVPVGNVLQKVADNPIINPIGAVNAQATGVSASDSYKAGAAVGAIVAGGMALQGTAAQATAGKIASGAAVTAGTAALNNALAPHPQPPAAANLPPLTGTGNNGAPPFQLDPILLAIGAGALIILSL